MRRRPTRSRRSTALRAKGLQVTLDHLGEDTTDRATADATVAAYLDVIAGLTAAGQVAGAEVSVKLSAVGQALVASPELPARRATPTRCPARGRSPTRPTPPVPG